MRRDLADIVCCPSCKGKLVLRVEKSDASGEVVEGSFWCKACRFAYPIEEGIPNLLPPEYHVDQVKDAKPAPAKAKRA